MDAWGRSSEPAGFDRDLVRALSWFNLAAARAQSDSLLLDAATGTATDAIEARDRVTARLAPAQLAEADQLARVWDDARPGRPTIPASRKSRLLIAVMLGLALAGAARAFSQRTVPR